MPGNALSGTPAHFLGVADELAHCSGRHRRHTSHLGVPSAMHMEDCA